MGDLNSRFGDNQEHIEGIDLKVPSRKVLDVGKNKHGDLLIDFLKDGQLCIVNGRVNPENDNFTFVDPGRGSSVVDFLIVPYCNLKSITDFHVHLARELMTNCNVDGWQYVVIGVIYRPPNSEIDAFNTHLTSILNAIKLENKIAYIAGDFNINLLNVESHVQSSEFIEMLYSYSYLPLINKPTRVTDTTATLIDNIFCNHFQDFQFLQGIFVTDISDHFPVFCIAIESKSSENTNIDYCRQYNENNIKKFCDKLQVFDWMDVMRETNCQIAFSKFYDIFRNLYDDCFPMRRIKLNYRNRKPYLTEGLKKSIKVKNKLYKISIKSKTLYHKKGI